MPPTIIDIGTDEDAGEWLRALPFVHFPVHPRGEDRSGSAPTPRASAPVNSLYTVLEHDLNHRLAIRKQQRLKRSCAAIKGWKTRRGA